MATLGVAYGGLPYQNGVSPEELPEEQYIATFFCRALYDYQTNDASSLSFRKNDIIEVLTQLESGWWDGLLGDERGWFPSNYVTTISDEEAELALAHYEQQALHQQVRETSQERGGHLRGEIAQNHYASETEWGPGELGDTSNGFLELGNAIAEGGTMSNDFWMPQVTQDGQASYLMLGFHCMVTINGSDRSTTSIHRQANILAICLSTSTIPLTAILLA